MRRPPPSSLMACDSQEIVWDAALKSIRIVLSTHQVLLDALTHAFIKLSKLAVIIFDEGGQS